MKIPTFTADLSIYKNNASYRYAAAEQVNLPVIHPCASRAILAPSGYGGGGCRAMWCCDVDGGCYWCLVCN